MDRFLGCDAYATRARTILDILRNASTLVTELIETRCHRGADIVRRLRLAEEAAQAVASLDEHWDGGGKPIGLKGEAVPLYCPAVASGRSFPLHGRA